LEVAQWLEQHPFIQDFYAYP